MSGSTGWLPEQALDEEFVRAAARQEDTAQVRAARAARITAQHARASGWRTDGLPARHPAPGRTTRRPSRGLHASLAALALLSVALWSGAPALARLGPAPGHAVAGPRVPPTPDDAAGSPLGAPPPAPAGEGGFALLHGTTGSRAVGWDPCRPVHWVLRSAGAPPGAAAQVQQGFARLSAATGLVFVLDGATTEAPADDRPLVQRQQYGDRWAPVLVAFADPSEAPELAGDVAGYASTRLADPDGRGLRVVTGTVVLDGPALHDHPEVVPAVVLHELGHLAGLDHVPDPADLMYAYGSPATTFSDGDLRGLARLGAARCFS